MSKKIVTIKIADIKVDTYVRKGLNQDHALFLASLIEAGVKLPPIKITPDFNLQDGRHRIEAHLLNGLTEIECEVISARNDLVLIGEAFRDNMGGSLPPTPDDIKHTIRMLLDRGMAKKDIPVALGLPAAMVRGYISTVESERKRQLLQQAANLIAEGEANRSEAAEKVGIKDEDLKQFLQQHNKRETKKGLKDVERNMRHLYQSFSNRVSRLMKGVQEKFEDGDISAKQVEGIFEIIDDKLKSAARLQSDRRKRFEATLNGTKETQKAKSA